ncbi:hypothetical protein NEOC65_002439 [Neochlamydia sp. AcF65]|nr:hypothetical protein [Neochlamydia sp. AcF65]
MLALSFYACLLYAKLIVGRQYAYYLLQMRMGKQAYGQSFPLELLR